MANIFEINARLRELLENGYDETCIDIETGEFDAERATMLVEELSLAREEKIDGIALYIQELGADAAALKAKADVLKQRAKAMESKAERLEEYLTAALDGEKYESANVMISFRKSVAVMVDESVLPDEYFAEKIERKPDKTMIKKALVGGAAIDGATLVENRNIQIK